MTLYIHRISSPFGDLGLVVDASVRLVRIESPDRDVGHLCTLNRQRLPGVNLRVSSSQIGETCPLSPVFRAAYACCRFRGSARDGLWSENRRSDSVR